MAAPTTAERVRSACRRAEGGLLAVDHVAPIRTPVHHLLADGSFAVAVPADDPVSTADNAEAVLELTDHAPLPLRAPVRSLVWIRGVLRRVAEPDVPALLDLVAAEAPNPALLQVNSVQTAEALAVMRLETADVVVADSSGAETVPVADLLLAQPDPFCAMESCWLRHLDADHPEVIDRFAARLPASLRRSRVRPLGLDRYGVLLRVEQADRDLDVRLPFANPVHDVTGLSRALRILMGCPFLNGLQARRR